MTDTFHLSKHQVQHSRFASGEAEAQDREDHAKVTKRRQCLQIPPLGSSPLSGGPEAPQAVGADLGLSERMKGWSQSKYNTQLWM